MEGQSPSVTWSAQTQFSATEQQLAEAFRKKLDKESTSADSSFKSGASTDQWDTSKTLHMSLSTPTLQATDTMPGNPVGGED